LHSEPFHAEAGTLYVVATPIGNLRDLTFRALDVLRAVDIIAAEDTRHSRHLLDHFGIDARLVAVHEHNERASGDKVVHWLAEPRSVALVTDAGTPGVSDPGALVVAAVLAAGYRVVPIPGASAVTTALSAAGAAGDGFRFAGFLPVKQEARRRALRALAGEPVPVVLYEAPHRIRESVDDFVQALGAGRRITFCRELTKLFETVHVCLAGDAGAWLDADPNRLRGEFVVVVHPAPVAAADATSVDARRVVDVLARALPPSQAARLAADITGARRGDLYRLALLARPDHADAEADPDSGSDCGSSDDNSNETNETDA
jgi:16S rRNA (cytidine1402-2'-O)-methyltransferase